MNIKISLFLWSKCLASISTRDSDPSNFKQIHNFEDIQIKMCIKTAPYLH